MVSHDILWGYSEVERFLFDQDAGTVTHYRGSTIIQFDIQIIGSYDFEKTTFMWSNRNKYVNKELTKATEKLLSIAKQNKWNIDSDKSFVCPFFKAQEFLTLAFYLNEANGIEHVLTNNNRTAVMYIFYNIRITDKKYKLFSFNIPTKSQYKIVSDDRLINFCKTYIQEITKTAAKYLSMERTTKDSRYADSLEYQGDEVASKYWNTSSYNWPTYTRYKRLIEKQDVFKNWRVLSIGDEHKYVLYEEALPNEIMIYTFEVSTTNGIPKIENEYVNRFHY